MSALQKGTARGRREAAGLAAGQPPAVPEAQQSTPTEPAGEPGTAEAKWSEAATVMFPVVPSEDDSITDKASDENHENRPEKDS